MECILGSIFDRFLIDFGTQVGTQNRPKKVGQEARQEAEVWSQVGSDAESAGRGEDYGGVHKTKFEGHLIRTLHKDWI